MYVNVFKVALRQLLKQVVLQSYKRIKELLVQDRLRLANVLTSVSQSFNRVYSNCMALGKSYDSIVSDGSFFHQNIVADPKDHDMTRLLLNSAIAVDKIANGAFTTAQVEVANVAS